MRNAVLALLVAPACTFSAHVEGAEEVSADAGVITTPGMRCQQAGLVFCLDFEGNHVEDPFGATLVSQNVLSMVRGPDENAAQFSATSSLSIANNPKLDIAEHLTVEMWMRPTQSAPTNGDKQSGLFDNSLQYWMVFENGDNIECWIGGQDQADSNPLALGAWHHVACTYDGLQLRTYVDGRLEACRDVNKMINTNGSAGAAVGGNVLTPTTTKNKFVGELDNVHVFDRTLSAGDICTIWGGGNCSDSCSGGAVGGE